MSKKKKFKKFSRAQIIDEIKKSDNYSKPQNIMPETNKEVTSEITPLQKNTSETAPSNPEYNYVKSDLKRIAVVFSVIIALLIGVIVLDKKTTWFNLISDNLANILHLTE